jgi:hypothetical protein
MNHKRGVTPVNWWAIGLIMLLIAGAAVGIWEVVR